MKKSGTVLIAAGILAAILLTGCGNGEKTEEHSSNANQTESGAGQKESSAGQTKSGEEQTRVVTDSTGRDVEISEKVDSIVCLNVGTLRYTCYMQAQELVVGVEDYEQEKSISRPYNYVNYDMFKELPVIGANGEHYVEEIIGTEPDVIMMSALDTTDAQALQDKTGIPVVVVPGSDKMLDEGAYETIRIMGEVYGKEKRAEELTAYLDSIQEDLRERTEKIPEAEKPSVYVGGVSFKGLHGFEGTEAAYGPFHAIEANNLADRTEQTGPFNIDPEQVLAWNPDVIFLDYNGLPLIEEDYAKNPDYYNQLKAVQEGKVYAQISFRSYASNLELALADTYYAASVLYPEQFADIEPEKKADEIFHTLLGTDIYEELKENGYEFKPLEIGKN